MNALTTFIKQALHEDVGDGDFSTLAAIPSHVKGKAILKIKEAGYLAGIEIAEAIFNYLEPNSKFTAFKKDGDRIEIGEVAFEIEADVHTILKGERLVLNCMQRMSGIATLTQQYVQALKDTNTRVLDTRKTTPLFRMLEKQAVAIGGGVNHRMGLYDMVMLKDNHIDYCGGIKSAIEKTAAYLKDNNLDLKIEIETRTLKDVQEVLDTGKVHRIMLDNFLVSDVAQAVILINKQYETEASGGITLSNIREYALTGVDYVSVGALTHHAVSLDLSLKAVIS